MYKVSVVVPIYNVEKYIVRCAECLFRQTLDEMQFVFVDDASSDNSIALLEQTIERFPERKPHTIILRHPENLGLPTARATGLARVEAPFVAHCDSDDHVESNMYARLYETAMQNGSDLVFCGWKMHYPNGHVYTSFDKLASGDSLICNYLYERLRPYVWRLLIRTDLCRRVKFPTENFLEDWVQTAQLLTYAQHVSFLNEALYHHDVRSMSITTDMRLDVMERKMQQCMTNYKLMHDFLMEHHPVEEKDFVFKKIMVRCRYLPQIRRWNIRKQYLRTFSEINFSMLFNRKIPILYKGAHLLVLFGLYPAVRPFYEFVKKTLRYR